MKFINKFKIIYKESKVSKSSVVPFVWSAYDKTDYQVQEGNEEFI